MSKRIILTLIALIGFVCITGCNETNYNNTVAGRDVSPALLKQLVDNDEVVQKQYTMTTGRTITINLKRSKLENRGTEGKECFIGPKLERYVGMPGDAQFQNRYPH